jgi:hypothetical protein
VLLFDFTVSSASEVTLRSYSYAGGTNAQGQMIQGGGFDPILALFDAAGVFIADNDDGGPTNVPTDPSTGAAFDVFFKSVLQPGSYKVAVTAFPNFAVRPNLSNGFSGGGTLGGRSPGFAFDVLGASAASGPGQNNPPPPSPAPTVIAFGRRLNADGTFVSGPRFFEQLGFNSSSAAANFASGSSFNNLAVGQAVPVPPATPPPPPPPPAPPPVALAPVSGAEVVVGPIAAATSRRGSGRW